MAPASSLDPLVTTHSCSLPLGPELGGARRSGVVFLSPAVLKIFVYVDYVFIYFL